MTTLASCARTTTPAASPDGRRAPSRSEPEARLADAAEALAAVGAADGHRIPTAVAERARCVAVVPSLVNGALIVGAKHGRGVVTCRAEGGWSSPAFFTLTGGTFGVEIGVQSVDLVMLVLTDRGKQAFLADQFELGGDMSASAGPAGRGREKVTDTDLRDPIVSYSSSRGAFAGVALSGVVLHHDKDAARAFYGHDDAAAASLQSSASPGSAADVFLARVRAVFGEGAKAPSASGT